MLDWKKYLTFDETFSSVVLRGEFVKLMCKVLFKEVPAGDSDRDWQFYEAHLRERVTAALSCYTV